LWKAPYHALAELAPPRTRAAAKAAAPTNVRVTDMLMKKTPEVD
jgi:hypothetical protein